MKVLLLLAASAYLAVAQQGATTPAPRLLALPEKDLCIHRPKQFQHNGHNYYFSWDQEDYLNTVRTSLNRATQSEKGQKVDWLKARNECRKRCMDAVGIESEAENKVIFDFLSNRKIKYIWTSGRLCDFKGCNERTDLHPTNVFGWFWSNTNTKMPATNSTPPTWSSQPWSQTGHNKIPQPDNAEFGINNTPESCMGVLNDIYNDGIKWHDIACYHKKPYICEDSDLLIKYIEGTEGVKLR